jgi:hypothetical protein
MQSSRPPVPWILIPIVSLLQWGREGLGAVVGRPLGGRDGSLDIGGAVLLVGAITLAATLGLPPVATLGGGIGVAILFVVARSWIVV